MQQIERSRVGYAAFIAALCAAVGLISLVAAPSESANGAASPMVAAAASR
jgi:hypothetical protein